MRFCIRPLNGALLLLPSLPLSPATAMLLRVVLAHGLARDAVGKLDVRSNRSRD